MTITSSQKQAVIKGANGCCEYCRISDTDEAPPFHIDHIVPIKHYGQDDLENLCLSCYQCNAFKGSNLASLDFVTGNVTVLFNPRKQNWDDHFIVNSDATLTGITPVGRVTIDMMRINDERRVEYRQMAMELGEYPCKK